MQGLTWLAKQLAWEQRLAELRRPAPVARKRRRIRPQAKAA